MCYLAKRSRGDKSREIEGSAVNDDAKIVEVFPLIHLQTSDIRLQTLSPEEMAKLYFLFYFYINYTLYTLYPT